MIYNIIKPNFVSFEKNKIRYEFDNELKYVKVEIEWLESGYMSIDVSFKDKKWNFLNSSYLYEECRIITDDMLKMYSSIYKDGDYIDNHIDELREYKKKYQESVKAREEKVEKSDAELLAEKYVKAHDEKYYLNKTQELLSDEKKVLAKLWNKLSDEINENMDKPEGKTKATIIENWAQESRVICEHIGIQINSNQELFQMAASAAVHSVEDSLRKARQEGKEFDISDISDVDKNAYDEYINRLENKVYSKEEKNFINDNLKEISKIFIPDGVSLCSSSHPGTDGYAFCEEAKERALFQIFKMPEDLTEEDYPKDEHSE